MGNKKWRDLRASMPLGGLLPANHANQPTMESGDVGREEQQKPVLTLYTHCMYIILMRYEWNPDKNEWLKRERRISFEQIVFHLSQGDIWKTADHPDQKTYPGQKIYFVIVDNYVHLVPYVVEDEYVFLKTIIPSRRATRDYEKGGDDNEAR